MKKFRQYFQKFAHAMGDVFIPVLLGLLLMALGYGLIFIFG